MVTETQHSSQRDEEALHDEEILDDEEQQDEDQEETSNEEGEARVLDPEKQALSREAARWRHALRAAEARIKELESGEDFAGALRSARLETAFLRAVLERGETLDVETAWDLANLRGFLDAAMVGDDGAEGMAEALDRVLSRYPWLADETLAEPDSEPSRRTASPPRKQKDASGPPVTQAQLKERFPALGRRR